MEARSETVVVTGASRGIGLELALSLSAEHGFHVFAGARQEEDLDAIGSKDRCGDTGPGRLTPIHLDITNVEHIHAAAKLVGREAGDRGVRGVINVAGLYRSSPLEFADIGELQRVYDVQVYGSIRMFQAFAPLLRKNASPRFVLFSSPAGAIGPPFMGSNALSRAATESMARVLRKELITQGVRVVTVWPLGVKSGTYETLSQIHRDIEALMEFNEKWKPYRRVWDVFKKMERSMPHKRGAFLPADVVPPVVRALTDRSPRTRYVVGKGPPALARLLPDSALIWMLRWKLRREKKG